MGDAIEMRILKTEQDQAQITLFHLPTEAKALLEEFLYIPPPKPSLLNSPKRQVFDKWGQLDENPGIVIYVFRF